ncbi:RelA/SpoT [Penicillium odoratum]|uniref:RelA/SpoT n=1 Tax=Penicillium odoratum TaxID=1167516 RepID=UPI0025472CB6|nr:RelA/SpoT [Penicillium odoratum]KAJ5764903.1 RelA/SpoT [Penicillium odoratum]
MLAARPESVISAFVAEYPAKRPFYQRTAKKVEEICHDALDCEGISHRPKSRAKKTDSLREKLLERAEEGHHYQTEEDIQDDIVDLAGVRIVLDTAVDKERVENIISRRFQMVKTKNHPDPDVTRKEARKREGYKKVFPAYVATHYRVRLKSEDLLDVLDLGEAGTGVIEIQVRTFVDDVHAEEEHEAYKSKSAPDPKMAPILDALSGAAQLFNALDGQAKGRRSKSKGKENRAFTSIDQLGNFLDKFIKDKAAAWVRAERKGNSWTPLFAFLSTFTDKNTQLSLEALLSDNLDAESESVYRRISRVYTLAKPTLNIFLMDRILLEDFGEPAQPLKMPEDCDSHIYKILTMKSTIIWLHKIFLPSESWTWIFADSGNQESLLQSLKWLDGPQKDRFGQPLLSSDVVKLDFLWNWFEDQEARHMRLAFTMAKHGMRRDKDRTQIFDVLINAL